MKLISLIITLYFSLAGLAQEVVVKPESLTERTWTITEDKQSGVGMHKPLEDGSTLIFLKDGSWSASAALEGAKKGKWSIDRNIILLQNEDGKKTAKFKVVLLNDRQLRFEVQKTFYTRSWEWVVK